MCNAVQLKKKQAERGKGEAHGKIPDGRLLGLWMPCGKLATKDGRGR